MNWIARKWTWAQSLFPRSEGEPEAPKRVTTPQVKRQAVVEQQALLGLSDLAKPAMVLALMVGLLLSSALMVIYSAYEYRNLFNQHQMLSSQGDELQVEWGQLLLEESAWSANNRVETLAEKKLNMRIPEPEGVEIVRHEPR